MKTYTIDELARTLGMSASGLRAWESRYNLVSASRSHGGHRMYDGNDLRFYAYICHLKNQGIKISTIAEKPLTELKHDASRFFASSEASNTLSTFNTLTVQQAIQALSENRIDDCLDAVDKAILLARDAVEFSMFALGLMAEVGEAWSKNRVSIASEHLISARIRSALSNFLFDSRISSAHALKPNKDDSSQPALEACLKQPFSVVVAGLPGDLHEMGLLHVAIHIQSWGLRVCYLGPTLPTAQLELFAKNLFNDRFGILCLGASAALDKGPAIESARFIDRFIGPHHLTFIGGGCTRHFGQNQDKFKNIIFSNDLENMRAVVLELHQLQASKTPISAQLISEVRSKLRLKLAAQESPA